MTLIAAMTVLLALAGWLAFRQESDQIDAHITRFLRDPQSCAASGALPPVVGSARPAGAASPPTPAPAGIPVRATSDLLNHAAGELHHVYGGKVPAVVASLQSELRLRAAEFAAIGD